MKLHRPSPTRRTAAVFAATAALLGAAACSDDTDTTAAASGAVSVTAAFYPLAEAAERVGGDCIEVTNLTPPGGGPHDLELTPKQVERLEQTGLLIYLSKGFQPAVEAAVRGLDESVPTLDVLDGIDLLTVADQLEGTEGDVDGEELDGGYDPHVWVDPVLQAQIATAVHAALVDVAPDCADLDANLAAYTEELDALHERFTDGLAECATTTIVTSHRAFEYLARRYDLVQVSIAGISPDAEPDPRSLEAVAERAKADGVTTIFFESQVPPALSETVAREIGATTDFLDPVESIDADELAGGTTYATVMDRNLASLTAALGCT